MFSIPNTPAEGPSVGRRQVVAAIAACLAAPLAVHAAEPLVIGQVAPFTGPQAITGKAINAGIKLYFDSINAKGGVRGRPIKLVTRDDAQKPDESVRLTKELIAAESPLALIGTVGTTNLEAIAKDGVLAQQRVPMIGAISGAATVAKAEGMRVVKASYHDEVERLFSQLALLDVKRVGLVYQDDSLGSDVLTGADAAAKKHGITLVARSGYARNTTAVDQAVASMVKEQPQVVFLGATTAAAIEFVRQYGAAGGKATLYGMSIIDTDALLKALGPERSRGYAFAVVLPLVQQTNRAIVREYLQLKSAAADTANLSSRSIEGFIAAKAIVKILESASNFTQAGVNAALAATKTVDLGNYVLDFSTKDRSGSRYVDFAMFGAEGKVVQ